jgi:Tol biopolymer transport system component
VRNDNPKSGDYARYDFADSSWQWITDFSKDSLRHMKTPVPSPTSDLVVQTRKAGNAEQLFLMNNRGENVRRITDLGGDIPGWGPEGSHITFRRDVHRGEGARYVPYRFDLETNEAKPLWPALPDSVPDFPPLSSQTLSKTLTPR